MTLRRQKKVISLLNVLFFAVFPVLALYAHNANQLLLKQLLGPVLISLLIGILFFLIWLVIFKNFLMAGLSSTLLLVISWNYGLLYTEVSKTIKWGHPYLMLVLLAFYLLLLAYLLKKSRHSEILNNLNRILIVPVSFLIIINTIIILSAEIIKKYNNLKFEHETGGLVNKFFAEKGYPDIYLIILDEYANLKTIKEEWGYDNDSFGKFLRNKGFFVAEDSEFRYSSTLLNIASLLNIDYVTGPLTKEAYLNHFYNIRTGDKKKKLDIPKIPPTNELMKMINNNLLTRKFKEYGYKIIVIEGVSLHYSSFKINNADISFSYQNLARFKRLFVTDPFYIELIKKSVIFPFVSYKIIELSDIHYEGTRHVLNYLTSAEPLRGPKFIYAHIMCPHKPFVFDREGNYVSQKTENKDSLSLEDRINRAYLDQYIYITREVKKIVNAHINNTGKNPVFIIQNDHGPRPKEVYLQNPQNAFNAFNAVYFPDGDYKDLYDNIAPVNVIRVVLNRYFAEDYDMLLDR